MPTNGIATSGDVTSNAATSPLNGNGEHASRIFTSSEKEIIRIIGQYLGDMGLVGSAEALCHESGCTVEHALAATFRSHVINGDWAAAEVDVGKLADVLNQKDDMPLIMQLLMEEKFLELLEKGNKVEALRCLRVEIGPLAHCKERIQQLSSLVMVPDAKTLYQKAGWPGVAGGARGMLMDKLQSFFQADIMLPPRRLNTLLQQALDHQVSNCMRHNTSLPIRVDGEGVLFFSDHACGADAFPSTCVQVCLGHCDEVWFCAWSPDGNILASCSKDGSVILWEYCVEMQRLRIVRTLSGHRRGASFCAFSPDNLYLLVCGSNEPQEAKVWRVQTGEVVCQARGNTEDCFMTGAWFPNSKEYIVASVRGHFVLCNLSGAVLHSWDGVRVLCAAIPPKSDRSVLAADHLKRVRRYDFSNERAVDILTEDTAIMSMTVSEDGRYILLNCANQGIHMWDAVDRVLVRKFQGVSQGTYTIHSCFGGVNNDFIASGSEDGKVYIFHRSRAEPVCKLHGHLRSANSVAWNPRHPNVLVSCSDDETLRMWCPKTGDASDEEEADETMASGQEDGVDRLFSVPSHAGQDDPDDD